MVQAEWSYEVDRADLIRAVGGGWDEFARENDAPELVQARVIGRHLWDYVSDHTTKMLLRRLLSEVRDHEREVQIPFRCDGKHIRRFMNFRAAPALHGGVQVRTRLVREEPVPELLELRSRPPLMGESMLRMCSWCNRIELPRGWAELADAVREEELFHSASLPQVTHGMCPTCTGTILAELEAPT